MSFKNKNQKGEMSFADPSRKAERVVLERPILRLGNELTKLTLNVFGMVFVLQKVVYMELVLQKVVFMKPVLQKVVFMMLILQKVVFMVLVWMLQKVICMELELQTVFSWSWS